MPETHILCWDETGQPRSEQFSDQFYSREDGRAECDHVFIQANELPARWQGAERFHIAELGFGTGLNFVETWRQWRNTRREHQHLLFTSFEAYPMHRDDMARALKRWPELDDLSAKLCDSLARNGLARDGLVRGGLKTEIRADAQTTLKIESGQALTSVSSWSESANAWYLDGFSPDRNKDMWSAELMQAVYDHTAPGGTFGTYAAAGWVRRNLAAAGFDVERRKGFGSKREMLAGRKPASA